MIVGQLRYYNEKQKKLSSIDLNVNGEYTFSTTCDEIQIKTLPNTNILINDEENILIGDSGTYNILYPEKVKINKIFLDKKSLERIRKTDWAYLIINFMIQDDNSNNQEESSSSTGDPTETSIEDQEGESSSSSSENKSNHDHR